MNTESKSLFPGTTSGGQQLEQYVLLAKSTKGASLKALVMQVVEAADIYFFGELLELQCIQNMHNDEETKQYLDLLNLFAYGTYKEFKERCNSLPGLTPLMHRKLRFLTVASLASESKLIPYSNLLQELEIGTVRELEDLLIAAIYADVIKGKLDQQNSRLEVDWAIGRDLKPNDVEFIFNTLQKWEGACRSIVQTIGNQVNVANSLMTDERRKQENIDTEISNIKKTIKATLSQQDMDIMMSSESSSYNSTTTSTNSEVKSKKSKLKGLRGSGKLWSKN